MALTLFILMITHLHQHYACIYIYAHIYEYMCKIKRATFFFTWTSSAPGMWDGKGQFLSTKLACLFILSLL